MKYIVYGLFAVCGIYFILWTVKDFAQHKQLKTLWNTTNIADQKLNLVI